MCNSDITVEEEKLIGESRQAFLELERRKFTNEDEIVSDDGSDVVTPEEWLIVTGIDTKEAEAILLKERMAFKRKVKVKAAKTITDAKRLQRKLPKKVSKPLLNYPSIGEDIDNSVKERKIGAHAWRRTGVLTFTYGSVSQTTGPKVTYKRIKEHLEQKYKTEFGYGTIVQLCVARNRRKLSAKRYKGVAKITSQGTERFFY